MSSSEEHDVGPPPGPAQVMKRAIILKHRMVKGMAASVRDHLLASPDKSAGEQQSAFRQAMREYSAKQVQQLREGGLWDEMDESEQMFMQADPADISQQALIDTSWLAESAVCLLWALGYVSELPAYDQEVDPDLTHLLPLKSVADLVDGAKLRPFAEIEKQRDVAELWHWRSRTRQLQESGEMPATLAGGLTIEQVIEMASAKAAEEGEIPGSTGGDFPAFSKAYRDLTAEEFTLATSIAQERHHALNWLCGYAPGNRWAETPTDT